MGAAGAGAGTGAGGGRAPAPARASKLMAVLNYRVRAGLRDGRALTGRFLAFDKHLNVVLGDCEETRPGRGGAAAREQRRALGLVLLRGEEVVALTPEAPPPRRL